MSEHGLNDLNHSLSRRSLLLGVGGGAVVSLLSSSGVAHALVNQISTSTKLDPEAALVLKDYFGARVGGRVGGNLKNVLQFISPDSRNLMDFESTRFGALSSLGSANRWNGAIDRVSSELRVLSTTQNGVSVQVLVQDWTAINWRPAPPLVPIERSPEEWAFVRKDPVRHGLNVPSWTPTESGFGTTHLVTLENVNGHWMITKDGYNEGVLGGTSPDYSTVSESQALGQASPYSGSNSLRAKIQPARQGPSKSASLTTHLFNWQAAMNYAIYWADKYNPAYQNWGSTNHDCANFVSQSYFAGAYPTDGTWSPYTSAWINNTALRNWLISSGRGFDESYIVLGLADSVNYSWDGSGTLDHIAMVTSIVNSVPLVSCHSAWQRNVPYNQIYYPGYMPNQTRKYTGTLAYYQA